MSGAPEARLAAIGILRRQDPALALAGIRSDLSSAPAAPGGDGRGAMNDNRPRVDAPHRQSTRRCPGAACGTLA